MNPHTFLPADDQPPSSITSVDETLQAQLEEAIARYFYESCDGVTQSLLTTCDWSIITNAAALTLVIHCRDTTTYRRVLNNLLSLATWLQDFASTARIRLYRPADSETPLDIQAAEVPVFRDLL